MPRFRVVTAEQLSKGYEEIIGGVRYHRDYTVIERRKTGKILVIDPEWAAKEQASKDGFDQRAGVRAYVESRQGVKAPAAEPAPTTETLPKSVRTTPPVKEEEPKKGVDRDPGRPAGRPVNETGKKSITDVKPLRSPYKNSEEA